MLGHGLASLIQAYLKPASPGADLSLGISGAGPWFGLSLILAYLKPASPGADLSLGISGAGPASTWVRSASTTTASLSSTRLRRREKDEVKNDDVSKAGYRYPGGWSNIKY